VYLTDDPVLAGSRLADAIAWCTATESGPELHRLAKLLRRWRAEILAHHATGASTTVAWINEPSPEVLIRSA